jgi:hypothetical protein
MLMKIFVQLRVGEHLLAPRESVVHMAQTAFEENPWRSRHSVDLRSAPYHEIV